MTYTVVVGLLGTAYALLILELTPAFGTKTPPWLVAGSTLVVAALFNPIRRRVQQWVDRRFDRARFDADRVAERFAERVRNATDLESATAGLAEVTGHLFRPLSVALWIDGGGA